MKVLFFGLEKLIFSFWVDSVSVMISVELRKTTFVFETRILVSDKNFVMIFFFFLPSWIPMEQQFVIDGFIGSLLFLSLLSVLNIVSSSFVVKSYPPFATQFSYLLRRFGWNLVGVSILVSGYYSVYIKSINNISFVKALFQHLCWKWLWRIHKFWMTQIYSLKKFFASIIYHYPNNPS